jgi:hypothetical protein
MASGDRNRVDHRLPDLARELFQLMIGKSAQIGGRRNTIKQRRLILGDGQFSAFCERARRINALEQL